MHTVFNLVMEISPMKKTPILVFAIAISIAIELIIIASVIEKTGTGRLGMQVFRLALQLSLIGFILIKKSNASLLLLMAYHIVTALLSFRFASEVFGQVLIAYHVLIGVVIYFHDWLGDKILPKKGV